MCLCSKSVFPFPPHRVDATGGNPERWENKSRYKSGGKCLGCRPLEIRRTSKVGDLELATGKSGKYICKHSSSLSKETYCSNLEMDFGCIIFLSFFSDKILISYFQSYLKLKRIKKTLPEAQRTQGIESITQIITHGKYHLGDEMIYMYD